MLNPGENTIVVSLQNPSSGLKHNDVSAVGPHGCFPFLLRPKWPFVIYFFDQIQLPLCGMRKLASFFGPTKFPVQGARRIVEGEAARSKPPRQKVPKFCQKSPNFHQNTSNSPKNPKMCSKCSQNLSKMFPTCFKVFPKCFQNVAQTGPKCYQKKDEATANRNAEKTC